MVERQNRDADVGLGRDGHMGLFPRHRGRIPGSKQRHVAGRWFGLDCPQQRGWLGRGQARDRAKPG